MASMTDLILHYVMIPFKIVMILILTLYNKMSQRLPEAPSVAQVDAASIRSQMLQLDLDAHFGIANKGKVLVIDPASPDRYGNYEYGNWDHQALRHGSLAWSVPHREDVINGVANYVVTDTEAQGHYPGTEFTRGVRPGNPDKIHHYGSAPAMGMSVAFAIMSGIRAKTPIKDDLKTRFLDAVNEKIKIDFVDDNKHEVTTRPRSASTAFDAIYALSLLYTAYAISHDKSYLRETNRILWKRGYAFLLLAPQTYYKPVGRRYFLDHIAIFGLWTAYQGCPTTFNRWIFQHAMSFIASQSYELGNPYFAALQAECGCLPEEQRKRVLANHTSADILKASEYRAKSYDPTTAYDWSTVSTNEFSFDSVPEGNGTDAGPIEFIVPLNGLCLARSLLVLNDLQEKS